MKAFASFVAILAVMTSLSACQSVGANNTEPPATRAATEAPSTPAPTPEPTPTPTPAPTPTPLPWQTVAGAQDFDMSSEFVGPMRLGMTETEVVTALGKPESKSEVEVWGADGMEHCDWNYPAKGYSLNMARNEGSKEEMTVYRVDAAAPCTEVTQRGIKIGDKKEDVMAVYADAVNQEDSTENAIVVGSTFGGIIFYIADEKVKSIFIGAAAE